MVIPVSIVAWGFLLLAGEDYKITGEGQKKSKAEDTDGSFPQGGSFLYPDISV